MEFDLVIAGGTLVTAAETIRADVGVIGDTIAALGHGLTGAARIDATGKLVLPGGVDPHVHLDMPVGATRSSDDWETGTFAAACGGTTTVIDFVEPDLGGALAAGLAARRGGGGGARRTRAWV